MQFSVDATRWQDFTRQLMQSRTTNNSYTNTAKNITSLYILPPIQAVSFVTFLSIVNDNAQAVIMICLSTIKTAQSPVNPRF